MSIDNVKNYISTVRRDFADKPFSEDMASDDPFQQYAVWFQEAMDSQILDPYAATYLLQQKMVLFLLECYT